MKSNVRFVRLYLPVVAVHAEEVSAGSETLDVLVEGVENHEN